ncbi:DUF2341 domain-containing protein [Candidatus Falkowbacteria bacterium]|nr:DUF2341 domain-containing protein [Candidatus Falkowbacteria bacterium]
MLKKVKTIISKTKRLFAQNKQELRRSRPAVRLMQDIVPPSVLRISNEVLGIKEYSSDNLKIFGRAWRGAIGLFFLFWTITGVGPIELLRNSVAALAGEDIKAVNLYAGNCSGGIAASSSWQGVGNASGAPSLEEGASSTDFNAANSAAYRGGRDSLVCAGFTTEQPEIMKVDLEEPDQDAEALDAKQPEAVAENDGQDIPADSPVAAAEEAPAPAAEKEDKVEVIIEEPVVTSDEPSAAEQATEQPTEISPEPVLETDIPAEQAEPSQLQEAAEAIVETVAEIKEAVDYLVDQVVLMAGAKEDKAELKDLGRLKGAKINLSLAQSFAGQAELGSDNSGETASASTTASRGVKVLYSTDMPGADSPDSKQWHELADLPEIDLSACAEATSSDCYIAALAGYAQAGRLSFDAPELKSWQDVEGLQVKIEGQSENGDYGLDLDSVWVTAEYDGNKEEIDLDDGYETADKIFVDGKEIVFEFTDDNSDENLIIKSNSKDYFGVTDAIVYFSVTNASTERELVNLQVHFPEDKGSVAKLEQLNRNIWTEAELEGGELPPPNVFKQVFGQEIKRKHVPETMRAKNSTKGSGQALAPGKTRYYKMRIAYPASTRGEFFIEAMGDGQGYGLLDPWWNGSWPYKLPITINNTANSSALTDYQVLVEIASTTAGFWDNVNADGSDIRFVNSAQDTQLDFWVQYFNKTSSSTQIWVQVDSIPAASSSQIYLYYGNAAAASTSDMYSTFSYATMQDLYYVVRNGTVSTTTVTVVSLIDNNQVQLNNGTTYNLNRQQIATITPLTATSTLRAKGPVQASITGVAAGATMVPISYAGTQFVMPFSSGTTETWSRYAPFLRATTTIYNGNTLGNTTAINPGFAASTAYNITTAGRLLSTNPILASYYATTAAYSGAIYPATTRDLYGIRSGTNPIGFTATTTFAIYCSSGASATNQVGSTTAAYLNTTCATVTEGGGNAVRLTNQTYPIGSYSYNDSDGVSMSMFMPDIELSTEYMVPRNAAYIAVACVPKHGTTTLSIYNPSNVFVASSTCTTTPTNPGKRLFGVADASTYAAGSRIVSTDGKPFYAYYEDVEQVAITGAGGDESNFLGAVQARKQATTTPIVTLGEEQSSKIVVSGKVYSDQGVTPLLTRPVVNLAVGGTFVASTTASSTDGSFSIGNVTMPETGSSTIVYLASTTVSGVAYDRYSGADNVIGLDIYQNHIIVRNDDSGPVTNATIDRYDADQDPFIKVLVSSGNMSASSTQRLYVWPGSTYQPGGTVTLPAGGGGIGGSLVVATSSILNAEANTVSVGSSWTNLGEFQKTGAQTTIFTAASAGFVISNSTSTFNNVIFNGGGGWSFATSTTLDGNLTMATGTLSGTNNITVNGGAASGAGLINLTGGTFTLAGTGDFGGAADWSFYDLAFGNGVAVATSTKAGVGTTTVADSLILNSNHILDAGVSVWVVAGPGPALSGNGSLTASTSLFRFVAASGIDLAPKSFYRLVLAPGAAGSPTYTLGAGTLSTADYLLIGNGTNPVTVTAAASNTALDINGDFTINASASFAAPTSSGFTVAGNWENDGTFINSAGTITFDADSAGKVINAGGSLFSKVVFNGTSGGWTIGESATSTSDWTLTAGTFIASSSILIEVGGLFYNGIGGASTTWAGTTLYLTGGSQTISASTTPPETYGTLKVGVNTDIRMWNSSASAYSVDPTGSLYSMDHGNSDGALNIWGDYHISAGTDEWSWQTDFDGSDLGGAQRQVQVALASGATVSVDGGTLEMVGSTTLPTTISNQGSGTYSFNVSAGTINADYYQINNAGTSGLNFSGSPAVNSLNNGDFQLAGSTGQAISLTASVINANPGKVIYGCNFATTTAITAAYNIFLASAASSNWTFANHTGNFAGDNYDSDPGDPTGYLIWDDSPVYTPKARKWRWYNDINAETPVVPTADEDTMPQNIVNGADFKLRQSIGSVNMAGSNVKMRLQYSTSPTFSSDVNFVGEIASTSEAWIYTNGTDSDNAAVSSLLLSDSSATATHNESGTSASTYTHALGAVAEWEFTLLAASTTPGTTYYFRPYFNNKPVTLEDGATRPSVYIADNISISGAVYSDDGFSQLLSGPVVGLAIGTQLIATTTASTVDGSFIFNNITQFSAGGSTAVFLDNSVLEASGGITYFNSASTPADNGSSATNPTVVTPPVNMRAGDLVILEAAHAAASGVLAISNAGGQTWNTLTQQNGAGNHRVNLFWTQFNGTWSANPSVNMVSAVNNIVVMHVFRPGYSGSTWAIDVPETSNTYAAASPVTITGITTQSDGALVFAAWTSADDNTWGTLTAGWSVAGSAQYRNTNGTSDQSISSAYRIFPTATSTGNVSKSQLALGPDAGTRYIIAFKEVKPASTYGVSFNRYAGSGDVANLDVYQDRVVVRNDDAGPITNSDINNYDADQNSQIKAGVASSNLTLPASQMLYIWPNSTFRPGGQVALLPGAAPAAIGGDLLINTGSIFNAESNAVSIGGNWTNLGEFQSNAGETVSFTATSTGYDITTGGFGFKDLAFTGVGGGWSFSDTATINGNLNMATGTLSGTTSVLVKGGSATGDGTINLTGGIFTIDGTGIFGGATDWSFYGLEIGDAVWTDVTSKTGTNNILVRGPMTINSGQTLNASTSTWTLAGNGNPLAVDGVFNPEQSTFKFTSVNNIDLTPVTFYNLELSPSGAGSPTYAFYGGTLATNNYLYIGDGTNPVTVTTNVDNPVFDINGDFSIRSGATFVGSAFSPFYAGGDWQNNGTYASNNGTVVFDAAATGKTVDAGDSPFHNVEFNGPSGGWTVNANATSTNGFSLLAGQDFTLSPAATLVVSNIFNNAFNPASTTWTGSILHFAGSSRTINGKASTSDAYGTIKVGADTDIRMWNSSATAYDIDPTSSFYSMDHGNIDGSLFIWGDYHVGAGQTEYWNWQTDFDGVSLSGSERQANVRLASSTNVTVDGGTLQLLGTSTATTTVDNQGSGRYGLAVTSGTLNADRYNIGNTDSNGLSLSGTSVITSLDNGEYVLGTNGGTSITVTPGLMAANPSKTISGCSFATSTGISGYNVALGSAATTEWTFMGLLGNIAGEDFDNDAGDPRGYILWDNSPTYVPLSQKWRWYHDEENETPTAAVAGEEVAPAGIARGNVLKLRLSIKATNGLAGSNVKMKLQYSTFSDFSSDVNFVGEIGSSSSIWNYGDGVDADNDPIISTTLSDSDATSTHNESGISTSTYMHNADEVAEWEFTIVNNGATNGTTYFFRAYTDQYNVQGVEPNLGSFYPSLTPGNESLGTALSGLPGGTATEGVVTDIATDEITIPFGNLPFETSVTGAHRLLISTNAESGYQLFVKQNQDLINGHGITIDAVAADNSNPQAWPMTPDPAAFGYHTSDDTLSGASPSRFAPNNSYAKFETSIQEVGYSPIPVTNDPIDLIYRIQISDQQQPGDYVTQVEYILVPTY